ncbi:16S rRNA (guanine(527)-N(7))-methyltransferase RsmG [Arcobacter sp. 15-2]|uniref:16S rRNA (guanine(527)-N(7))-methyltransferase RsmG n=1 Tax=Arcobacter sp. 15-2 TaxID=3374109 RepID=UPI00399C55D4
MLKEKLTALDLHFDDLFYERCEKYIALLQQWGKIHNLTASLKDEEIINNIVDSVYPLKFIDSFESLADVGTGAGYPGMLLAIARPESKVVLVEPRAKRVAFLNFVKSVLKLENVSIEQKRIEQLQDYRFDIITSRAVTNTTLLLELTSHLKDENTQYLFYKGSLCEEEIKDANVKNAKVFKVGEHRNYLYMNNEEK